ncbi:MAG: pentapeptide repeat-containing protein [Ignavibacteria bacterium]|nr:pentapeptide repeat-containing protein [Ignavibacteria bacterium]
MSIIVLLFGIFFNFFMIPWSLDGDRRGFLNSLLYVDLSYQMLVNEPNKDYKTLYWANLAGANLVGANFTGSILKRADLKKSNLKKANFFIANLEGARLDSAQLQGAKHLTIEQLSKVKTLYDAKLDSILLEAIKRDYPHLLELSSLW